MNQNLIPFDQMSSEQHRELSRRGGIASGEARRRKAALRAYLVDALEKQYLADEIMDEFDKALAIVKQRDKRRRQDAQRKRTKRGRSKAEPRGRKENG